jgi:hypothetical protein
MGRNIKGRNGTGACVGKRERDADDGNTWGLGRIAGRTAVASTHTGFFFYRWNGFFDVRNRSVGFLTYRGSTTITALSRIISRDLDICNKQHAVLLLVRAVSWSVNIVFFCE